MVEEMGYSPPTPKPSRNRHSIIWWKMWKPEDAVDDALSTVPARGQQAHQATGVLRRSRWMAGTHPV